MGLPRPWPRSAPPHDSDDDLTESGMPWMRQYFFNTRNEEDTNSSSDSDGDERLSRSTRMNLQHQVQRLPSTGGLVTEVAIDAHRWTFSAYKQISASTAARIDMDIGPFYPEGPPTAIRIGGGQNFPIPARWRRNRDYVDLVSQFSELFETPEVAVTGNEADYIRMQSIIVRQEATPQPPQPLAVRLLTAAQLSLWDLPKRLKQKKEKKGVDGTKRKAGKGKGKEEEQKDETEDKAEDEIEKGKGRGKGVNGTKRKARERKGKEKEQKAETEDESESETANQKGNKRQKQSITDGMQGIRRFLVPSGQGSSGQGSSGQGSSRQGSRQMQGSSGQGSSRQVQGSGRQGYSGRGQYEADAIVIDSDEEDVIIIDSD